MNTSQALAPMIALIKTWTIGIALIAAIYIAVIFFLKFRGMQGRELMRWKNGLHILTVVIMFAWTLRTLTH